MSSQEVRSQKSECWWVFALRKLLKQTTCLYWCYVGASCQ